MLAVSELAGFPLADIAAPCASAVVVGNGGRAQAEAVAERIARQIWRERDEFVHRMPIAAALVECDSRGVTSSDYGLFAYEHVRRPVYPLDKDTEWTEPN
jgi:microcystin degradation protein MlrC